MNQQIFSEELEWPDKYPDEILDYAVDMSGDLKSDEAIQMIGAMVQPWGPGELYIGGFTPPVYPSDDFAIVWLSGGVPGRAYLVKVMVQTNQDRRYEYLVTLKIDATLAVSPLPLAPNLDFSTMVMYGGNSYDAGAISVMGAGTVLAGTIVNNVGVMSVTGQGGGSI